ncbi:MAG TPA: transglycosylase SLT domain-containing protein [Gammaproteobacteria bacterium]|nr:transglycosylase SLT domain-containing protein [Gammaproteobacteria bacterium]HEV2212481.1 transglycosylase SLT domain-containing protein [Gammaproteobacteria bacterium]
MERIRDHIKKLLAACLMGGLLLSAASARAGDGLTRQQNWAVLYASVVGTSYYADPLPQSYDFERTLTAVLTQESSLCHHKKGMDKASYGCGQIQKRTALLVNGKPVAAHRLQHDDAFNIRMAARYLAYCMQQMGSWERSVICYNKGPYRAGTMTDKQVAKDSYLSSVRHRMNEAGNLLANVD